MVPRSTASSDPWGRDHGIGSLHQLARLGRNRISCSFQAHRVPAAHRFARVLYFQVKRRDSENDDDDDDVPLVAHAR